MARNSPLFAAVALTALLSCAKATPLGDDPVLLTTRSGYGTIAKTQRGPVLRICTGDSVARLQPLVLRFSRPLDVSKKRTMVQHRPAAARKT